MKFCKTETLRSDLVGFGRANSNLQTDFENSNFFCPTTSLQISACRVSGSGSGSGFLVFWFSGPVKNQKSDTFSETLIFA